MFKIETDVPVPTTGKLGSRKYPFEEMQVGNSFVATGETAVVAAKRVRASAYRYGKAHGTQYSIRVINPTQVRIWRIA